MTDIPILDVLTSKELCKILNSLDILYRKNYFEKHGKQFTGKPVISVERVLVQVHKDCWSKI